MKIFRVKERLFDAESGKMLRFKNLTIKVGKTRDSVYRVFKRGKKLVKKFLGYISKTPKKYQKKAEASVRRSERRKATREKSFDEIPKSEPTIKIETPNKETTPEVASQQEPVIDKPILEEPDVDQVLTEIQTLESDKFSLLPRDIVELIDETIRAAVIRPEKDDTIPLVVTKDFQNEMNFSRIMKMLRKDGLITLEKIEAVKNEDYEVTSISQYMDDLFKAYEEAKTDKEKSKIWD